MTARKPVRIAPAAEPWSPVPFDRATVFALKALQDGKASEGQQKRALAWIIHQAAATYDLPFRPGGPEGDRATVFATGRMFLGQQLVKLLNLPAALVPPAESEKP